VQPLAERDGQKERDYEQRTTRFWADLPSPESLGEAAGRRAAERLGARKIPSGAAAVIFENRIAGRILAPMLSAISGGAVARGVSFLKDKLGANVFSKDVTLMEDPIKPRGLSTRAFDAEGCRVSRRALIDQGVLTTWLLNAASARQLGLTPSGHAVGGHGGPPGAGASNLDLSPGPLDLAGLMQETGSGLLVTEMFSPALNPNTGDWSVGVAGFWYENGERKHPVSEVTVAGSLLDIYARLAPGADLDDRGGLIAPSLLVEGLAIGGA
jgi:PmbA protein